MHASNRDHAASPQPSGVELAPGLRVSSASLDFSFVSSSGPGGQNVNKRATKAVLRVPLDAIPLYPAARERFERQASLYITSSGDVLIECDEHRSQERNKGGCLDRLRALLIEAMKRPKVRKPTKPSRGAKERRLKEKRVRSEQKRGRRPEL